jgi:sorting nexin-1/2
LGNALYDFGDAVEQLSSCEINKSLERHLHEFAEVNKELKPVQFYQAEQDLFTLANAIDEYVRIIGSIEVGCLLFSKLISQDAFQARAKAWHTWQTAEQNLAKAKISFEKAKIGGKTKGDKLSALETEINEHEDKLASAKKAFQDISKTLRGELENFEDEKVDDFQSSMQGFLDSMLKTQQKVVVSFGRRSHRP